MSPAVSAWRCFPWDPAAPSRAPFSPTYVQPRQTAGRFDLHDAPAILYLSESATQAIAELLQGFRGSSFHPGILRRHGHGLAVVSVTIPSEPAGVLADLCDPACLLATGIGPDRTAHHDRLVTQPIARGLHQDTRGYAGLRWWSALTGAWHTVALFLDRVDRSALEYGTPTALTPTDPDVLAARGFLGIE